MNQKNALVIVTLIVVATLTVAATPMSYVNVVNAIEGPKVVVHAGGGNNTSPLTAFAPQQVRVNAGQSVTWDNPSVVGEPHTVTFVLDNKTATNIVSPFAVPRSTQFSSIPPSSNNEPLKAPGPGNVVIAINARTYIPTVIDSQGNVKHFPPPNANYSMIGSEKYVNSGWLLPKPTTLYPNPSNTFTVTFQKAGTYSYLCEIHPWMAGVVTVK